MSRVARWRHRGQGRSRPDLGGADEARPPGSPLGLGLIIVVVCRGQTSVHHRPEADRVFPRPSAGCSPAHGPTVVGRSTSIRYIGVRRARFSNQPGFSWARPALRRDDHPAVTIGSMDQAASSAFLRPDVRPTSSAGVIRGAAPSGSRRASPAGLPIDRPHVLRAETQLHRRIGPSNWSSGTNLRSLRGPARTGFDNRAEPERARGTATQLTGFGPILYGPPLGATLVVTDTDIRDTGPAEALGVRLRRRARGELR